MKFNAWSLMLPLAAGILLVPASSYSGVAQHAPAAAKEELPPGPGREPFLRICTGCHGTSVVASERHTAEAWSNIIDAMRARGANGSDDDMDKITDWLAANYPPKPDADKPAPPPPALWRWTYLSKNR